MKENQVKSFHFMGIENISIAIYIETLLECREMIILECEKKDP